MRLLVCGSRTFSDRAVVFTFLDGLNTGLGDDPELVVIQGGATGADTMAAEWAETWGQPQEWYPADWDRYGKRAGFLRNEQMLEEERPDLVVAFVDKPLAESKGTCMMVNLARNAGLPVYVVQVFSPRARLNEYRRTLEGDRGDPVEGQVPGGRQGQEDAVQAAFR